MYSIRAVGNGLKQAPGRLRAHLGSHRGLATSADAADVAQARKYCLNQLRSAFLVCMFRDLNTPLTAAQTRRL